MIPILFSFIRIFFIVHYVVTRKCYHLCQLLRVSKFSCNWLHRGTNPLFGCYHPVCDSYAQPHSCVQASAESSITWILVNPCGAAKAVSHLHIASAKAEFSCNVLLISVQRKLYHIRTLLPRKRNFHAMCSLFRCSESCITGYMALKFLTFRNLFLLSITDTPILT